MSVWFTKSYNFPEFPVWGLPHTMGRRVFVCLIGITEYFRETLNLTCLFLVLKELSISKVQNFTKIFIEVCWQSLKIMSICDVSWKRRKQNSYYDKNRLYINE